MLHTKMCDVSVKDKTNKRLGLPQVSQEAKGGSSKLNDRRIKQ